MMEKILKGPVEVRNVIISEAGRKCADPEYRSFRSVAILLILLLPNLLLAQGDVQLRAKADALFEAEKFAEAMPMYSQLVSLEPSDRTLNYLFGTCILFGGADKEKAIGHLKYATDFPAIPTMAWYWLGRAYHLNYRFKDAQTAYQRFVGTGDRKALEKWPVEALQQQCRNGEKLLSNLKEIKVRNKVEVNDVDFFRFYDLSDIGGKIVVMPEELKTSYDKKKELRSLVYLPDRGGTFYFGSYGKDGKTGLDIYRSELVNGSYASPVKLAGYINTDQDEDFAFLHPDGKTFYFSSKGHSSMGGYDVFRASFDKGLDAFGRPENMDFAVNTPDDDIFYIVDPDQKEACFASARSSSQGICTCIGLQRSSSN
ncbi:MAG: PD40 domain-containing protein [Flavobacteriales bacterium]|nr:PD40 domain-containing protein [Flavobacteriales bacterium]